MERNAVFYARCFAFTLFCWFCERIENFLCKTFAFTVFWHILFFYLLCDHFRCFFCAAFAIEKDQRLFVFFYCIDDYICCRAVCIFFDLYEVRHERKKKRKKLKSVWFIGFRNIYSPAKFWTIILWR